jgi:hypothetical protein
VICLWIAAAVTFLLLGFVNLAFDYLRVHIVLANTRAVRRSAGPVIRSVLRQLNLAAGPYTISFLLVSGASLIYYLASAPLSGSRVAPVLALLAVRQGYVMARGWCQLVFLAAQMHVYRSIAFQSSRNLYEVQTTDDSVTMTVPHDRVDAIPVNTRQALRPGSMMPLSPLKTSEAKVREMMPWNIRL